MNDDRQAPVNSISPRDRVALSVLGTGRYEETMYSWHGELYLTRYFPAAVKHFFQPDQLIVAMTEEARQSNAEGLGDELQYDTVCIPSGRTEEEYWEIFTRLADAIPERCELLIDITHGFRSQPLFVLAIAQYLSVVKDVKVRQVIYGAFEARADDVTPIFDLTPFLDVLRWSDAASVYAKHGAAGPLRDVIREGVGDDDTRIARRLRTISDTIDRLALAQALNRPGATLNEGAKLANSIESLGERLAPIGRMRPLETLLSSIVPYAHTLGLAREELFSAEGFEAQAAMIRRYLDTGQFVQALTLAREAIVSKRCTEAGGNPLLRRDREPAEEGLKQLENDFRSGIDLGEDERALIDLWIALRNVRNDVNHAGMSKSAAAPERTKAIILDVCPRAAAYIERRAGVSPSDFHFP